MVTGREVRIENLDRIVMCHHPPMIADGEYCAFTKALEHLGDRWSLLIVRDLMIFGSLGFNALASGLPGISRSVLAARLHHLADLSLVARSSTSTGRTPGYHLTDSGKELGPVVMALRTWAERWIPEDPAMLERDPDIVVGWLANRIDPARLPDRQVVLDLAITGSVVGRCWVVLERGNAPSVCIDDPMLSDERYVFVEADVRALALVARGTQSWAAAIAADGVRLFGDPGLVQALPGWFRNDDGAGAQMPGMSATA